MIENKKKKSINLLNHIKNNLKYIISVIIILILSVSVYQLYIFYSNKKLLELSVLYDEAQLLDNSSIEFEKKMILIAKENNIFGTLASLNLIKNKLENKNYNEAYTSYLTLLKSNKENNIYKSIIALHGSYNLFDTVSSDKIKSLLSYIDENLDSFKGYHYEILFLLSIKDRNNQETEILYNKILENEKISETIKNRIQKISKFEKYK